MITRTLIPQAVATPRFYSWQHNQDDGAAKRKSEPLPALIRPHPHKRHAPALEKRATTQRIFETLSHESERSNGNPYGLKNATLKYVLYHPPTQTYFKVDRRQYPQVITPEQAKLIFEHKLQKNPHAGRLSFVDGFHQIKLSAAPLQSKEGKVLVRLKGPIVWPLWPEISNNPDSAERSVPPDGESSLKQTSKLYRPWQLALQRLHAGQEQPHGKASREMDIIVEFTNLLPDGYTEELEVFPTEELPKLWRKQFLNLEA